MNDNIITNIIQHFKTAAENYEKFCEQYTKWDDESDLVVVDKLNLATAICIQNEFLVTLAQVDTIMGYCESIDTETFNLWYNYKGMLFDDECWIKAVK